MTKLQKQQAAYGLVLKSLNVEIDEGILRECLLPYTHFHIAWPLGIIFLVKLAGFFEFIAVVMIGLGLGMTQNHS